MFQDQNVRFGRPFPQSVPAAYLIDHPEEAPCKATCPIGQDVQGYLALVAAGKLDEAHALIRRDGAIVHQRTFDDRNVSLEWRDTG